jgi:preprotein translocase subunit YajC
VSHKVEALPNIIFLAFMIGIFYLILIRPQKRKAQQHQQLVNAIDVGDEVVMIGGEIGTVRSMNDEEIVLEVAPGVRARYLRAAIRDKFTPAEEEEGDLDAEDEADA